MSVHTGESGNYRSFIPPAGSRPNNLTNLMGLVPFSAASQSFCRQNVRRGYARGGRLVRPAYTKWGRGLTISSTGVPNRAPRPDTTSAAWGWTPPRLRVYNPRLPNNINGGSPRAVSTSTSAFRLSRRLEDVVFSDIVKIRNNVIGLRAVGA